MLAVPKPEIVSGRIDLVLKIGLGPLGKVRFRTFEHCTNLVLIPIHVG